MDKIEIEKLNFYIRVSMKHILRLNYAFLKMKSFFPIDIDNYENLSDEKVEHIDQFIYRFSKLQDTMGNKLFKTLLINLDEDVKDKPFIEILNLLEKYSILKNANDWRELRKIRNDISHEYIEESEENVELLNKLYLNEVKKTFQIFANIIEYIKINNFLSLEAKTKELIDKLKGINFEA